MKKVLSVLPLGLLAVALIVTGCAEPASEVSTTDSTAKTESCESCDSCSTAAVAASCDSCSEGASCCQTQTVATTSEAKECCGKCEGEAKECCGKCEGETQTISTVGETSAESCTKGCNACAEGKEADCKCDEAKTEKE